MTKQRKTKIQRAAEYAAKLVRKGWCRGAYAKTKGGNVIGPLEANAASWCALGAMKRAVHDLKYDTPPYDPTFTNLITRFNMKARHGGADCDVATFNDKVAYNADDVAKVFDEIAGSK